MNLGLAPLVLLLSTLTPLELEYRGTQHLVREFERAGRPAPEGDATLAAAARTLAREALASDAASDTLTVAELVSDAGGADPTPRVLVVRGTPPGEALGALLDRSDFARADASHLGLGAAFEGDRSAVAILLADRHAELEDFPRTLPRAGAARTLCGHLHAPLGRAEVYATQPSGRVTRGEAAMEGQRFCAKLEFAQPGRYTVEVVARGPAGPEVVALFFVDAGARFERGKRARITEPTTVPAARKAVAERINALRLASGLSTLQEDELLDKVAQDYSERMARESFFAHVSPAGQDFRTRLRAAGYLYSLAGENLGVASGPLAAHFGIEHSPGHRKNLLDSEYTKVGIGVAFQRQGDREQVLVTELFAAPNRDARVLVDDTRRVDTSVKLQALDGKPPADAGAAAYRALDERRKALGRPPLPRSDALELMAADHARRSRELDEPLRELSSETRAFARQQRLSGLTVAAAKLAAPGAPPELPALKDPGCGRVGAAALRTVEPGKPDAYWVAVICASPE